jgi:hypothetical protein
MGCSAGACRFDDQGRLLAEGLEALNRICANLEDAKEQLVLNDVGFIHRS